MLAAILNPGPSLANLATAPSADLLICVNRAACRFPTAWWVAMDFQLFTAHQPIGDPQLVTRAAYRPKYTTRPGIDAEALSGPKSFDVFSSTTALVLAAHLGATKVNVYGYDATNAPDFDGVTPCESKRTDERWEHEARIWNDVRDWMVSRGIEVNRIKI